MSYRAGITFNLKKNIIPVLADEEAEFDDESTIRAIKEALEADGLTVDLFEAEEDLPVRLLNNRPDFVFNIAEGREGRGREAQVPAILSFLRIPFTGSDETTLCIAMDKALTKRLVASHGVCTPNYELVKYGSSFHGTSLSFPLIVKPNCEGSGKGVSSLSVVENAAALRRLLDKEIKTYKQDMLIEEYIKGREFTVGILGNGDDLRIFPPMEIIFFYSAHSIYSYEVKRDFNSYVRYECPARINEELLNEIKLTAEKIYRSLECRDLARLDFRLSREGRLYFIVINPLPGLAPGYSDFPMIASFCGIEYKLLIRHITNRAFARYGLEKLG